MIVHFELSTSFHIWTFSCTLDAATFRIIIDYFNLVIPSCSKSSLRPSVIAPLSSKVHITLLAAFELLIGGHQKLQASNSRPSV